MSRWTTITIDDLKAVAHGSIITKAQTLAVGSVDPTAEAIANAIARIRRAVATGNVLDTDATKVPASFKGTAVKLAVYDLTMRIGMTLTPAQSDDRRDITSDLNRVSDQKIKVEKADDPETTATVEDTGMKVSAVGVPRRMTGRGRTSGL